MFPAELETRAVDLIALLRGKKLMMATAESCTGGLIGGLITSVSGSSDVLDCGYVTYSNRAKSRMVGVPASLITRVGAVSEEVARAMAEGAVNASGADIAVAVTGVAGPGGGTPAKPVGLVHCGCARRGFPTAHQELRLGDIGREAVRLATVAAAIEMAYVAATLEPAP